MFVARAGACVDGNKPPGMKAATGSLLYENRSGGFPMTFRHLIPAALAAALCVSAPASAAVLFDDAPVGFTPANYVNQASGQNFLMRFTIGTGATVNGLDIFTYSAFATLGKAVTIKIRSDVGGNPAAANLAQIETTLSAVTPVGGQPDFVKRVHADFGGVALAAGSYWIGMSGAASELGIYGFQNGGPDAPADQRQLAGNTVTITPSVNNLAFTVYGNANAVPEPAAWALMISGFGLVGAASRRRTRQAIVAV